MVHQRREPCSSFARRVQWRNRLAYRRQRVRPELSGSKRTPRAFPAGIGKKNPAAQVVIHPRVNAVLSGKDEWTQRDWHVHKIRSDGVEAWRRESGYYRQSTVENTFYRYKTIIGKRLRARGEDARQVEATLACKILNRFLEMGKAESIPVA